MRPVTGPQTPAGPAMPPAVRPAAAMQPQYAPAPAAQPRFVPNSYPDLAPEPEGKSNIGLIIGVVFLLVLIVGGGAYFWFSGKTPDVTVYSVGNQNGPQDISGGGLIYPKTQSTISYPVAERVINVMVKPGDQVTAKQPLIQLDPAQLNAQVQQAQGAVEAAQANYNTILASGTATNIANAQQQLANAKNVLAVLQSQVNSPFISNGNLLATQSGVVTQVSVNPGDVFNADTPLIIIMDETTLYVHAKIPLANLGMVKLNEPAVVTASALPGVNIQGTVSSIIPQADPQTDTFEVWVQFDNTKTKLNFVPGMSAFVHIQSPNSNKTSNVQIPRAAVINSDDADSQSFVFVVKDDQRAHLQRVEVVGRSEQTVYVDSGVNKGDKVVLVGQDKLEDGQPVRVKQTENGA
ncbi:MAG: efflux RND transporter periplasmic adaptor subunit [Chloroflexi bacterium]|nr:efflux RND transporter periplasmic adaptor subunit [Chloroflexota bacterium]